jgi:uncharacterized protein with PQ loop repeat
MSTIIEIIGWLGVTLSAGSTYPQLYKTFKNKKAGDISVHAYTMIFIAVICYLIKAISIGSAVFIVSNTLNTIGLGTMLFLIRRYNGKNKNNR